MKKLAEKNIEKWKIRLGFSDWEISAKITTFRRTDCFLQDGDIIINYPKKQATILIGTILKAPVEEIVIHELVHLMLWPLDQRIISIIKTLPQTEQKRAEEDFLSKLEDVAAQITKVVLQGGLGKK
ncbi:MAG: hypothetical protein Q7R43_05605 [Candidatus Daviesbacteria bacterium]|nr:hypothetical protein [Candidatus Daviesbacteria bacterium]